MKVNILFDIRDVPYGGGNQFLKALKKIFEEKKIYAHNVKDADVILFNSHHNIKDLLKIKNKYKDKLFVHRIDGPVFLYRGSKKAVDNIIYKTNSFIADGTIYQSNWSRLQNIKYGLNTNTYETIIYNAPDKNIFNTKNKSKNKSHKIRIIATSWSNNFKKGFKTYSWLDKNLDFNNVEFTFVGNSPISFKNINIKKPLKSKYLSKELKKNDIFITASEKDPCSNSLIEALSCRLPAIALLDGGHPEIIKGGGELFTKEEEIPELIDKISKNYEHYKKKILIKDIYQITNEYFIFFMKLYSDYGARKYIPKKLNILKTSWLRILLKCIEIKK
ncbi:glycosyltransferase [Candidatus Woesearchaeota archaeon]|nr:glycosyltransferase [Candidatus Woesearchaeota archaeon]MCF7900773.1 glycosyltransferase [Candidatus Woesearchaeota archaeon]MCF8012938.1 glycosyltransferase [Candidatus Woesearchaeota archaeon]